jgi:two-component system CheB/CheR fusion protein
VDDLLDLSRIGRGAIRLTKGPLNLEQPVQQAVEAMQPLVKEKSLTLAVTLPRAPLLLEADATRFQQIVGHLLGNAVKYTDPGGKISLSVCRENDAAILRVRDTGIGIAAEMLPRVFDTFVQAERRLDHSTGGLGVGLSLVRRLVELHDGTISVHSEGTGLGTEFTVRLPALPEQPPCQGPAAQAGDASPDLAAPPRRVLVVDDNVDAANSLAQLLRLQGHQARVAYEGAQALTAITAETPELVILDLGMPTMDGFELARTLRSRPETKDVLMLALTGLAQEEDRRRCSEAGFDGHLLKPVELPALREFFHHPRLRPSGSEI